MSVFKTLAGGAAHLERGYAYMFLTQVTAAVKKLSPRGVMLCWEGGFDERSALLPDYKSNREASSEHVRNERAEVQRLMRALGADQCFAPGKEADDAIASLANTDGDCVIMSADKDMLQLVRPGVAVYQKVRGAGLKSQREVIDHQNFQDKTGWLNPAVFLEAHCALGDAVDQIPKLAGVGEKFVHLYHMGGEVPPSKRDKLDAFYAGSEQYRLNRQLIDLTQTRNLELVHNPGKFSDAEAYRLLTELGFDSLAAKYDQWVVPWEEATANADVPAVS